MINNLGIPFKKSTYQTLNEIGISQARLLNNLKILSKVNNNLKIAPVLKSNAYGHGLKQLAQILDSQNCPYFCVDSLYEAYELLKLKVKTPVLIMGYTDPKNLTVKKLPFSYAIFDLQTAQALNKYQPGAKIHLFVDTGMNREGVKVGDLTEFINRLSQLKSLQVEGLMSHLASARNNNDPLLTNQLKNFKKALEICQEAGLNLKWIHLGASDGLFIKKVQQITNLARTGLALYGISDKNSRLKPVLKLTTRLIQIKKIKTGDKVGYDGSFIAKKDTIIGILPIGYFDGVDRRLSNKGLVLTSQTVCPIIGKVSMNLITVDISKVKNPRVGQEVVVYSDNPENSNSIAKSAAICQTIPYDILTGLSISIRKTII